MRGPNAASYHPAGLGTPISIPGVVIPLPHLTFLNACPTVFADFAFGLPEAAGAGDSATESDVADDVEIEQLVATTQENAAKAAAMTLAPLAVFTRMFLSGTSPDSAGLGRPRL